MLYNVVYFLFQLIFLFFLNYFLVNFSRDLKACILKTDFANLRFLQL